MKRTVPLLISALAGFVLIASRFVPFTQKWGEKEAIWFDVLASIAFVLGGGSLLKLHLKRISDRVAGWGYSVLTLVSFFCTLAIGMAKFGVPPSPEQEFYGASFARLEVADLPESTVAKVDGSIPQRGDGEQLPLSVRRQLREENGQLVFRGWMTSRQKADLADYKENLDWQCTIEKLFKASQPSPPLKGKIEYLADHSDLAYRGLMSDEVRDALVKLNGNERWNAAVRDLYDASRKTTEVAPVQLPPVVKIPAELQPTVSYQEPTRTLAIRGPMSTSDRDALARAGFPLARPMTAAQREKFRSDLESHDSALNKRQATVLDNLLLASWGVDPLRLALNDAGKAVPPTRTACELEHAKAGAAPAKAAGNETDQTLNARQRALLDEFAVSPAMSVATLAERLRQAGPFGDAQAEALDAFFAKVPTVGEQKLALAVDLLKSGPLSHTQRDFLLNDYREQNRWRRDLGRLFVAAHVPKYPWSGEYNFEGSPFGWLYEFIFKPMTATLFSLLAFYVASAAFRAFRAKNFEAILLLGTAFIILLGQTFAGYWLTSWLPDNPDEHPIALLRIENLKFFIMKVFQTAGQRAIMIGVALGLAATSLKVLLGIDRSYLGTGED